MKRLGLVALVLLLSISGIYGQEGQGDSARFQQVFVKIAVSNDSVNYYLDQATSLATAPYQKMQLNRQLMWYLLDTNELDSAIATIERNFTDSLLRDTARQIQLEIGMSYYSTRAVYTRKGDYHLAILSSKKAVETFRKNNINVEYHAAALQNLGIDYWRSQTYDSALFWQDKAIAYGRSHDFIYYVIGATMDKGLALRSLNRLEEAEEHYKLVFEFMENDPTKYPRNYMANSNNLAIVYYFRNELDSALRYYQTAYHVVESGTIEAQHKRWIPLYRASISHNIGKIYDLWGDFEQALSYFDKAIRERENFFGTSHRNLISTLLDIGSAHLRLGNYQEAEIHFRRALGIANENSFESVNCYNWLGRAKREQAEYEQSLAFYDSAVQSNPVVVLEDGKVYTYPDRVLISMGGRAATLAAQGNLEAATVETLFAELKRVIAFLYINSDNVYTFSQISEILEIFYQRYAELGKNDNNANWNQRLWEIAELTKSAKLRLQLRDSYSLDYSIPDDLLAREKQLQDSINLLISEIQPNEVDSALFYLKAKYDAFILELESDFPNYQTLKTQLAIGDFAKRIENLQDREVLLNFFEGEENVYLIRATNQEIKKVQIDKDTLDQLIDEHSEAIFNAKNKDILEASEMIRKLMLLTNAELESIDHLTIVPDGIIWKLSFAALAEKSGTDINYLGNQKTISFHYFGTEQVSDLKEHNSKVLAFSFNEESDEEPQDYLSFRDLNIGLPGTSEEVVAIAEKWKGDYFFAKQANETLFKNKGGAYGILHLAVHGSQDNIYPENSFLKFASSDSMNDGRLYSYEIYNLDLNAELAVLSACNSGQGKIVTGEGMMSMSRAFAYAGVKSLIGSRWRVSDKSTALIMGYMYEGLKDGMRKSEALKYAQNQFLLNDADDVTASPFFWSAFYVIGDDRPLENGQKTRWWILGVLGLVVIVSLIYYRRSAY